MNKKLAVAVFVIVLAFIVIIVSLQYVAQKDTKGDVTQIEDSPITIRDEKTYISDEGEARARFLDREVFLTIMGSEYRDITLQKVGSTSSGSRYENKDLDLVLLEKTSEISAYKGNTLIFSGRDVFEVFADNLTSHKWVWEKTYNGTGPNAELNKSLFPRKSGAFTITFTDSGKISGTTDCNNFSGTYTYSNIQPSVSTRKICKGSQEGEFLAMITGASFGIGEQELYIEGDKTLVFSRGEKIK